MGARENPPKWKKTGERQCWRLYAFRFDQLEHGLRADCENVLRNMLILESTSRSETLLFHTNSSRCIFWRARAPDQTIRMKKLMNDDICLFKGYRLCRRPPKF